jgi:hypothetical protein
MRSYLGKLGNLQAVADGRGGRAPGRQLRSQDLSRASRQIPFLRLKYIFSPHLPGPLLIMP